MCDLKISKPTGGFAVAFIWLTVAWVFVIIALYTRLPESTEKPPEPQTTTYRIDFDPKTTRYEMSCKFFDKYAYDCITVPKLKYAPTHSA